MMRVLTRIADLALLGLTFPAGFILWVVRRLGMKRLRWNRQLLRWIGVFPIRDHFYEPLFDPRHLRKPLEEDRRLPGIDLNVAGQLELLRSFKYGGELKDVPFNKSGDDLEYYYHNISFTSGDAEYLYAMVRHFKPKKIIEIGCGFSTLMIEKALRKNRAESAEYNCEHISIEPYGPQWLSRTGAKIIPSKLEEVNPELFQGLGPNDILFIDSSHIIRPQGDVLMEYLEILPIVGRGVLVHVHDVFTPRDYLREWLEEYVFFWNEQYLLEAFLTQNPHWKVLGAVNYLKNNHFEELAPHCPGLSQERHTREPGSFWMVRV